MLTSTVMYLVEQFELLPVDDDMSQKDDGSWNLPRPAICTEPRSLARTFFSVMYIEGVWMLVSFPAGICAAISFLSVLIRVLAFC